MSNLIELEDGTVITCLSSNPLNCDHVNCPPIPKEWEKHLVGLETYVVKRGVKKS